MQFAFGLLPGGFSAVDVSCFPCGATIVFSTVPLFSESADTQTRRGSDGTVGVVSVSPGKVALTNS
jgi:hypothetical protein